MASWMKNTGMLLPTRSKLPSSVKNFTAKPRTSRTVSPDPRGPLHRGKANEHRSLLARVLQEAGLGQHAMVLVGLEVTVGAGAASMDDALGNAFVVKVRDFFTHDEVFQQRRPARAGLQGVLVIRDFHALIGAQGLASGVGAKLFQAVELGVGVAAVQGIGPGQCALGWQAGKLLVGTVIQDLDDPQVRRWGIFELLK
jgi:hypothetical protein